MFIVAFGRDQRNLTEDIEKGQNFNWFVHGELPDFNVILFLPCSVEEIKRNYWDSLVPKYIYQKKPPTSRMHKPF